MQLRRVLPVRPLAGLVLSVALASCGDDSPGPIAYDDLGAEYAAALCDLAVRCPQAGFAGISNAVLASMSPETCVEVASAMAESGLTYDGAIASGRITYDGAAARRCLDALTRGCVGLQFAGTGAECVAMFQGTVPVGAACEADQECADGGSCRRTDPSTCGGICEAGAVLGQACGEDAPECSRTPTDDDEVLGCLGTPANAAAHCVPTRVEFAGAGAPCGQVPGEGDSFTFVACGSHHYCRIVSGTTGTCETPLATGATCAVATDACADGGFCTAPGLAATGACAPLPLASEVGAACSDTILCNVSLDLVCVEGACAKAVRLALGAECSVDEDACADGLYCHERDFPDAPVCARLLAAGVECGDTGDESCASKECDDTVDPAVCAVGDLMCD